MMVGKKKPNFVDLFCGAGGLSLGLEQAGFENSGGFDIDEKAIRSYGVNFGNGKAHLADVSQLTPDQVLKAVGRRSVDVIAASPPCQGFSKQNRHRGIEDPRNDLVWHVARLVKGLMPKFFVLENVPELAHKDGRDFVEDVISRFEGYEVDSRVYSCLDYGVPQKRRRLIMVGTRKDLPGRYEHPKKVRGPAKTVRDSIGDMPSPPEDLSVHPEFHNHVGSRLSAITILRFSHVPQGGGWKDIPEELIWRSKVGKSSSSAEWPDVFGRLWWDEPAPTITCGCHSFTKGRYGHPSEDRPLTPRECARIQSFPDHHFFDESRIVACRQIGNSVPPLLAKHIGFSLLTALSIRKRKKPS